MNHTIKDEQWYSENGYTLITPEIASEWLKRNTQNRTLREKFVKTLMTKIEDGEWQPMTLDAIGFYEDGTLANGQHRLTAISRGSTPVYAKVEFNIPKDAAIAIDTGRSRSAADNIQILTGKSFYTRKISQMISLCAAGKYNKNLTPEQHYKIAKKYEDEILIVKDMFDGSPRYISDTSVMAAVFTALMSGVSADSLYRFVSLLNTPIAHTGSEATVVAFSGKLLQEYSQKTRKSRKDYGYEIRRCQNVIYHFVHGNTVTQFVSPNNYRYPLVNFDI